MDGKKQKISSKLYIVRSICLIVFIIILCWLSYKEASSIANLFVVTTDGMTKRAEYIIESGDPDELNLDELNEYFLPVFLERDSQIRLSDYQCYTVTNYDYTVKINKIHVLPWSKTAKVYLKEIVPPINGTLNENINNAENISKTPPIWPEKNYVVSLVSNDSKQWYIKSLEEIASEEK